MAFRRVVAVAPAADRSERVRHRVRYHCRNYKLEQFHNFCKVDFVVSHPFHKEREMDGARSFLTLSVKMF
jgi:hypothetical protein